MLEGQPLFVDRFVYDSQHLQHLKSLGSITFPIKNKSKNQNTHITNFQFEVDKNLKQETFMLCFDLMDKAENKLLETLQITDGMTGRQFMFKI